MQPVISVGEKCLWFARSILYRRCVMLCETRTGPVLVLTTALPECVQLYCIVRTLPYCDTAASV